MTADPLDDMRDWDAEEIYELIDYMSETNYRMSEGGRPTDSATLGVWAEDALLGLTRGKVTKRNGSHGYAEDYYTRPDYTPLGVLSVD